MIPAAHASRRASAAEISVRGAAGAGDHSRGAEPVQQLGQGEGDHHGGVGAAGGGQPVGRVALEELAETPAPTTPVAPAGSSQSHPGDRPQARRGCGQRVQGGGQHRGVQGGDLERPGHGAVAVVAQLQPGPAGGGAFLGGQPFPEPPVGLVGVEHLADLPTEPGQPGRVVVGGQAQQVRLGTGPVGGVRGLRELLQPRARSRWPGRGSPPRPPTRSAPARRWCPARWRAGPGRARPPGLAPVAAASQAPVEGEASTAAMSLPCPAASTRSRSSATRCLGPRQRHQRAPLLVGGHRPRRHVGRSSSTWCRRTPNQAIGCARVSVEVPLLMRTTLGKPHPTGRTVMRAVHNPAPASACGRNLAGRATSGCQSESSVPSGPRLMLRSAVVSP